MDTPQEDEPHKITVQRAVKPDGSETYTIELCPTLAAVIIGAANLANLDPGRWVLRSLGEAIADATDEAERFTRLSDETMN